MSDRDRKRPYLVNEDDYEFFGPTPLVDPLMGNCCVCQQPLGIQGGMAGTGMCGPCCTGEAETLEERGQTW